MLKDFKQFAMRGNVLDMSVAVVVGGAFGKIVSSFVSDLLMPPLGMLMGKVDFSNIYINLSKQHYSSLAEAKHNGAPTINIGLFINTVIDFLIISFAIFLLVKFVNKLKSEPVPPPPDSKACNYCFSTIHKNATRCPNCTSELSRAT